MHRRALPAALLALGLGGCSAAAASSGHDAAPTTSAAASSTPSDDPVTFVVVGDSLTAGSWPVYGEQQPGPGSWIPGAERAPLVYRGGWAVPGATTADMRAGVVPSKADVVVVLAGTNDVERGVPWETSRDNLVAIAATSRVDDVVLSTVPPLDTGPQQAEEYNQRLHELALEQGWHLVDPWVSVDRSGAWAPGTSGDGIHPTPEVADAVGRSIRAAVLDAAGD
jgi:lysophospholipase L1-like esterase